MNDPLTRKMFRQAGMSKQPMGILASSPELMNAAKGYNLGGIQARDEKTDTIDMPFYGVRRGSLTGNILPNPGGVRTNSSEGFGDPNISGQTPLEVLRKRKEAEKAEENKNVDTSLETLMKPSINDTNKKIIEETTAGEEANKFGVKKLRPSFMGKKDDGTVPTESNVSADKIVGDYKEKVDSEIEAINTATKKIANGMANTSEMKYFSTTYDKENKKLINALKKENKEPTFADVKDIALELGYKDPKTLDGEYSEAKEASVWLNMMKAGLAVASGESSNAMTNIAKGFAFGLDGYGKDIGKLSDDLKEDKKEYSKTMFKLLGDERSRKLAENALEIQKQSAITTILKEKSGEERDILIKRTEMEIANRKMTINLYKSFADLGFEKLKFNVGREDVANATKLAYSKMQPDSLKLLIASGDVKVLDPSLPLTPDNIEATPLGQKKINMLITQSLSGKITDTDKYISSMGASGSVEGLIIPDFDPKNSSQVTKMGILNKNLNSANSIYVQSMKEMDYKGAGNALMTLARNQELKISLSKLNPKVKKALTELNVLGDPIFTD